MARHIDAPMTEKGLASISLNLTDKSRTVSQMKDTLMRYMVKTLDAMLLTMRELKRNRLNRRKTNVELRYKPNESYSKQRVQTLPSMGIGQVA